jgi:glycolate oxidase FAD binding subunit
MQELDIKIISPETAEETAEVLRAAWEQGTPVNIRGGGTKQDLGNLAPPPGLILSTLKMDKLVDYEPSDLTITVQAGMRWDIFQGILAERGQWLPLDPPELEGTTVGGVVAANVSGPKRLMYGTLRDLVIGCQFVLADGNIGRSGGRVVKNVTGYDLHKLLIGSYGTLALLTELTFKVMPKPQASNWLVAGFDDIEAALSTARQLARSNLSPAAIEILNGASKDYAALGLQPARCVLFAAADGVEVAVTRQIEGMVELYRQQKVKESFFYHQPPTAQSEAVWQALRGQAQSYSLQLKISSLRTDLPYAWSAAQDISQQLETPATLQVRAGTGLLYLYANITPDFNPDWITQARQKLEAKGGSLVIERATDSLKEKVEVWGNSGGSNSLSAMQTIKRQLDEKGILNPGKFLKGI